MTFPDSKNIILISFLLRPNFSTKSSGLPDFYRVKLDVIGNKYKLHFWNRETSYNNALCSDTCPNYIGRRKILQGLSDVVCGTWQWCPPLFVIAYSLWDNSSLWRGWRVRINCCSMRRGRSVDAKKAPGRQFDSIKISPKMARNGPKTEFWKTTHGPTKKS